MPLNIKDERVSRLAEELARTTGESITDAVGRAIEARLFEINRHSRRRGVAKRLMEIGRTCASEAPSGWLTRRFDDELYDERGLPR